jgi:iron complex transport system permease protein
MKNRIGFMVMLFSILLIISGIAAASLGVVSIPFSQVTRIVLSQFGLTDTNGIPDHYILTVLQLRLPRIIMSLMAGAALAICGAVFQSVFRNPICDPYILGISSGASLGAAIAFIVGLDVVMFGIAIPALITAIITLFIILGIAGLAHKNSVQTLLLTGIAVNFLISAVITLLIVLNKQEMQKIIFWTMGSFASVSYKEILFFIPLFLSSLFVLFFYSKDLNIMQLGSDSAKNLGVNSGRVTIITLFASSLLIAAVVSICGVIGFIGLIVPHIVRLIWGNNNRILFIFSIFIGALFLLIADTLSRTIAFNSELPVGSITAIAGAPYFIYLLLRRR